MPCGRIFVINGYKNEGKVDRTTGNTGRKIVLTNGFVKKTNKTPPEEIEKAKRYRDIYIRNIQN